MKVFSKKLMIDLIDLLKYSYTMVQILLLSALISLSSCTRDQSDFPPIGGTPLRSPSGPDYTEYTGPPPEGDPLDTQFWIYVSEDQNYFSIARWKYCYKKFDRKQYPQGAGKDLEIQLYDKEGKSS